MLDLHACGTVLGRIYASVALPQPEGEEEALDAAGAAAEVEDCAAARPAAAARRKVVVKCMMLVWLGGMDGLMDREGLLIWLDCLNESCEEAREEGTSAMPEER